MVAPTKRIYLWDGELFAVATNPGWGGNGADYSDHWTKYYCLDGIWGADEQTQIVDGDSLLNQANA